MCDVNKRCRTRRRGQLLSRRALEKTARESPTEPESVITSARPPPAASHTFASVPPIHSVRTQIKTVKFSLTHLPH
ncbi:hypothetical protein AMELA_G00153200 [Ameiurus melas]|uniref:Uncharacterized protein n=1 Tax=Ameiurus melas TaxID=219545 RepID=A0A7J6AI17_AMEME|nr:hypothetical protein AMELA_G00153200 [Ameiurus melas]